VGCNQEDASGPIPSQDPVQPRSASGAWNIVAGVCWIQKGHSFRRVVRLSGQVFVLLGTGVICMNVLVWVQSALRKQARALSLLLQRCACCRMGSECADGFLFARR